MDKKMPERSLVVERNSGVASKSADLEHLFTFEKFPVYLGCVETKSEDDLFLDMEFCICKDTGVVQIKNIPSENLLYALAHADTSGPTWDRFRAGFADFSKKYVFGNNLLEIGGGNGKLAHMLLENYERKITIIDPNPFPEEHPRLNVISDFFTAETRFPIKYDTIIHANVLEHMLEPDAFLEAVYNTLADDGMHVFCFPDMQKMLRKGFLNTINFEHNIYYTERTINFLLKKNRLEILEKQYFAPSYSIFYATRKSAASSCAELNEYTVNKADFMAFYARLFADVKKINEQIDEFHGKLFCFGSHIFTQYLIAAGLQTDRIICLLDNSKLKHGKRLYGTEFISNYPDIIADIERPGVILHVAQYKDEIVEQLLAINPTTCILGV